MVHYPHLIILVVIFFITEVLLQTNRRTDIYSEAHIGVSFFRFFIGPGILVVLGNILDKQSYPEAIWAISLFGFLVLDSIIYTLRHKQIFTRFWAFRFSYRILIMLVAAGFVASLEGRIGVAEITSSTSKALIGLAFPLIAGLGTLLMVGTTRASKLWGAFILYTFFTSGVWILVYSIPESIDYFRNTMIGIIIMMGFFGLVWGGKETYPKVGSPVPQPQHEGYDYYD